MWNLKYKQIREIKNTLGAREEYDFHQKMKAGASFTDCSNF